ncbi:MAG: thiamine phosphate synthase, partial [Planctomycetota bacterium]
MAERGDPTRLVDANGNRAAEGLRVLEDLARFLLDDADLSRRLKELRHELRAALPAAVIAARDTPGDVGTRIAAADEGTRARLGDLITANARRAAEALRVLEECGKLPGLPAAAWEGMRYRLYECERLLQARLQLARLWRERLYVLVDAALCADPVAVAGAAAGGGAGIVQLRAKALAPRPYAELARAVQAAARSGGALFVVNDHPAVAAAIGADGVHVGQDDLSLTDVRRVVGPLCLIGSSAHTPDQLRLAESGGADYCGLGPMYA